MHYVHVKLLNGFSQLLTYKVPFDWQENLIGSIVKVPLKNKFVSAYVVAQTKKTPTASYIIKEIHSRELLPTDLFYQKFIQQLSYYYQVEPIHFLKRIKHFIDQEANSELPLIKTENPNSEVFLTDEQQYVVNQIKPTLGQKLYSPSLLHGVTGSGKTEIYKELIKKTIELHKTAIFLLPEVSLALRFEQTLKKQLSTISIFGFHSATSANDKKILWRLLLEKKPLLIIGVHIPILLPIANLGLIIVDEEHEIGYQEKKHPKVNSKEAALIRAQLYQIPIVLGSATPSVASLYVAKTKQWNFYSLKKRFAGSFPDIKIVLLTNKERRRNFWITTTLEKAITDRLSKKEQTIIFLNRRGYSFFVQCKNCSFVFQCNSCSVSLTLHNNNELTCHYCGHFQQLAISCPSCKKSELIKKGVGTQQVVSILQELFPKARIGRADMDVTSKKKIWQKTIQDFENGDIDILVGTQTITKGFHFPNVTLVGILWADLNLHFPVYNAAETCLQQLIQVAGRAGRQKENSVVIIQTMIQHHIFNFLNEIDYLRFYEHELNNRLQVHYPPILRLVEIELKNENEIILDQEAHSLAQFLLTCIQKNNYPITVLGPAKPPVAKIKNMHSCKIYLKNNSMKEIIELYKLIDKNTFKSHIFFTPNPN